MRHFYRQQKSNGGVKFYKGDGVTERLGPACVDFNRLLGLDTLISDPPRSIGSDFQIIGWFDQKIDFVEPAECWVLNCVLRLRDTRGRTVGPPSD